MTSCDIRSALERNYQNGIRYIVANCYFFGSYYGETDLLLVKEPKGYIYDIEIKISRADFFRDMLKIEKHKIISTGALTFKHRKYISQEDGTLKEFEIGDLIPMDRPNRFYFAVPAGLVNQKEVPTYAGLLFIHESGRVDKIKEAPLLHKGIIESEKRLCRKFYYYWLQAKEQLRVQNGKNNNSGTSETF